jgi:hypothetical protein
LKAGAVFPVGKLYAATVYGPPNAVIAPAGYYLFTVVNFGTPSASVWIHIG